MLANCQVDRSLPRLATMTLGRRGSASEPSRRTARCELVVLPRTRPKPMLMRKKKTIGRPDLRRITGPSAIPPSPTRPKSGAGSHVSPVRPQDVVGANTLLAISNSATKPGAITKKKKKKKGVVQVARGFSDSEESDGALTSPGLRRAPPPGEASVATTCQRRRSREEVLRHRWLGQTSPGANG